MAWEQANKRRDDANQWSPEPGEVLTGRLDSVITVKTKYGDKPVALITPDGNSDAVEVWMATVLEGLWDDIKPAVGDQVRIEYLGKVTNKAGSREYHDYNLWKETAAGQSEPQSSRQAQDIGPQPTHDDDVPF